MAFLTVTDLSGRADVSRPDMVLACLVTRVGMRFLSRLIQSAGWVLGEGLIKIGIGEFVHLDSPWLRWSCRCGEVRVGSTPKPPYVSITLASADAVGSVNLANSTAETFIQTANDSVMKNVTNCFTCHNPGSYNFQTSPPKLASRRIAISHVLGVSSPYAVPNQILVKP